MLAVIMLKFIDSKHFNLPSVANILGPLYEPGHEKTRLSDFRPGPTQTGLCSHRNFGCRKKRNCTMYVAKTKTLISCGIIHS